MTKYINTDKIKTRQTNGGKEGANANANTVSAGLYATWLKRKGWFIDTTFRNFWSNMKANSITSNGS